MFCLLPDSSMFISTLPLVMMRKKPSVNVTSKRNYFPCKFCDKTFTWKNSLQTHVSNIHGESRGPFPCPLCGKLSKNKKSLTTHLHDFHRKLSTLSRGRTKQRLCQGSLQTRLYSLTVLLLLSKLLHPVYTLKILCLITYFHGNLIDQSQLCSFTFNSQCLLCITWQLKVKSIQSNVIEYNIFS